MKLEYKILMVAAALAVMSVAVWILVKYDLFHQITALINENTPDELFILMMASLPLVGVPISFFLFFLGVKFGIVKGLLVLASTMPVHMLVAYFVALTLRKPLVGYLVNRKNYQIPQVPADKEFIFSFLFLTFPVFPYAVKIYMLPLAGIKFRYCFWLNWAVQGTMCIPFVLLGRSAADLNLMLFGVTIAVFAAMYIFLRWAKKQYLALQKEKLS